jgi:DNA-binding transcriptional ArsR family regulator
LPACRDDHPKLSRSSDDKIEHGRASFARQGFTLSPLHFLAGSNVTAAEVAVITSLPRRSTILVYLHAPRQWAGKVADLARAIGLSQRRVEMELRHLEGLGLLRRHEKGARNYTRLVRFEVCSAIPGSRYSDPQDRGAAIPRIAVPRSIDRGTPYFAGASDPISDHRQTDRGASRKPEPEPEPQPQPEPAELADALARSVARRWQLDPAQVRPGLGRLLAAGASERELGAFLADAERGRHAAFGGVDERRRFGCSCTAARFEIWRESRRARPIVEAPIEREPDALSPEEIGRRASEFLRKVGRR